MMLDSLLLESFGPVDDAVRESTHLLLDLDHNGHEQAALNSDNPNPQTTHSHSIQLTHLGQRVPQLAARASVESKVASLMAKVGSGYVASAKNEAQLESFFEQQLLSLGYEQLAPTVDLEQNLRSKLTKLNGLAEVSDAYWNYIYGKITDCAKKGLVSASSLILRDGVVTLSKEDLQKIEAKLPPDSSQLKQLPTQIKLFDFQDLEKNSFQVLRQHQTINAKGERYRFDVTVLINGLPLVQIELKRPGEDLDKAFRQIENYKDKAYSNTLYDFLQIFVISNGNQTRYYSNSVRKQSLNRLNFQGNNRVGGFEFTNVWADEDNRMLHNLDEFTASFFSRQVVFDLVTKYATITNLKSAISDEVNDYKRNLLVMRPYQYYAAKKILKTIADSVANDSARKVNGVHRRDTGGYIWHSTGSGKTFTSFKVADLATEFTDQRQNFPIDKVLLVVDRSELDLQTANEFASFDVDGREFSTNSTSDLEQKLAEKRRSVHVTTIQKLSNLISRLAEPEQIQGLSFEEVQRYKQLAPEIFNKRFVFIFDECHRSQHGSMHQAVKDYFNNYNIFGLTGTPIFAPVGQDYEADIGGRLEYGTPNEVSLSKFADSLATGVPTAQYNPETGLDEVDEFKRFKKSTEYVFGKQLHVYNLRHALEAKTVLPLQIDYVETFTDLRHQYQLAENEVLDEKSVWQHKKRIENVVAYILQTFHIKTNRELRQELELQRKNGFNGLFTVDSIASAKLYYAEFKRQIQQKRDLVKQLQKEGKSISPQDALIASLRVSTCFSVQAKHERAPEVPAKKVMIKDGQVVELAPAEDANSAFDYSGILGQEEIFSPAFAPEDKVFMEQVIKDYDAEQGTNFATQDFSHYYDDVSARLKSRELDLLIVVDMFLTGFDSKTLNTLWVDRELRLHGLIQAFSRTNRCYNSRKLQGNVVCFRDLEKQINQALDIYGLKGEIKNDLKRPTYKVMLDELIKRLEDLADFCAEHRIIELRRIDEPEVATEYETLYFKLLKIRNQVSSYTQFHLKAADGVSDSERYLPQALLDLLTSIYNNSAKHQRESKVKVDASELVVYENKELLEQFEITPNYLFKRLSAITGGKLDPQQVQAITEVVNATAVAPGKEALHAAITESLKAKGVDVESLVATKTPSLGAIESKLDLHKQTAKQSNLEQVKEVGVTQASQIKLASAATLGNEPDGSNYAAQFSAAGLTSHAVAQNQFENQSDSKVDSQAENQADNQEIVSERLSLAQVNKLAVFEPEQPLPEQAASLTASDSPNQSSKQVTPESSVVLSLNKENFFLELRDELIAFRNQQVTKLATQLEAEYKVDIEYDRLQDLLDDSVTKQGIKIAPGQLLDVVYIPRGCKPEDMFDADEVCEKLVELINLYTDIIPADEPVTLEN